MVDLPKVSCLCPQTYSVDRQVPDSASTATAYLCGVKTNYKTIGVSAAARFDQCNTTFGNEVFSVIYHAKIVGRLVLGLGGYDRAESLRDLSSAGKSGGVVTSTKVQHQHASEASTWN